MTESSFVFDYSYMTYTIKDDTLNPLTVNGGLLFDYKMMENINLHFGYNIAYNGKDNINHNVGIMFNMKFF